MSSTLRTQRLQAQVQGHRDDPLIVVYPASADSAIGLVGGSQLLGDQ